MLLGFICLVNGQTGFALAIHSESGTDGDEPADNHVFLEAAELVGFATDGSGDKHASGVLE